jgi:hypothetical protein
MPPTSWISPSSYLRKAVWLPMYQTMCIWYCNVVLEGHVMWTKGDRWGGRGEGWEQGESVYCQPGARVDKHSHHEIKIGGFPSK